MEIAPAKCVCVCVRARDRKRKCSILTSPLGDTPAVHVCLCLLDRTSGRRHTGEEVREIDRDTVCLSVCVCVALHTSTTLCIKSLSIPHMKAVIIFTPFGLCPGSPTRRFISLVIPGENFQFQLVLKYVTLDVQFVLFKSLKVTSPTFNL